MKKVLIFGKNGQVGWDLVKTHNRSDHLIALDRSDCDLANSDQITNCLRYHKPDLIINAAAYTAVDLAEKERDLASQINHKAPEIMAREAKQLNAMLIHYSTDYVFNGTAVIPYTESDPTDPINFYGKSKLAGEQAIQASGCNYLIFRTSWVYAARGRNFFLTMLKLGKERELLKVVDDQIGAPTWSKQIAEATWQIIEKSPDQSGLYHLTAAGSTTWCQFARRIFASGLLPKSPSVQAISTSEYPTPAKRPAYSVLSNSKIKNSFNICLPDWQEGLQACCREFSC